MFILKYEDSTNEWNTKERYENEEEVEKNISLELEEVIEYFGHSNYSVIREKNVLLVVNMRTLEWAKWAVLLAE